MLALGGRPLGTIPASWAVPRHVQHPCRRGLGAFSWQTKGTTIHSRASYFLHSSLTHAHIHLVGLLGIAPTTEAESQSDGGWKGPLRIIQSNLPTKAGSPSAGCRVPRPGGFWVSPETEAPQPFWTTCSRALSTSK